MKTKCLLFTFALLVNMNPLSASGDVVVSDVSELKAAIADANKGGDPTILLTDGTYPLNGEYLRITADNVTVGSQSRDRDKVVLDGKYQTTEIFQIVAANVTLRDLTLKKAQDHPIHVMGGQTTTNILLSNLRIIDPGQQAIKINPSGDATSLGSGIIENSLIELTGAGRVYVLSHNGSCYTGGVDAHAAEGWVIRDNLIRGFWCAGSLSEHGIHLWSGSRDTLVERNLIIDCDRGIGFGLGDSPHYGGIIRNNMIYHPQGHGQSDVGIGLENASDAQVYNNTIYLNHTYQNAIEYRFPDSRNITIANNLTNKQITSRQGGEAELLTNVTNAQKSWFVDLPAGDLHLDESVSGVVNSGTAITGLVDDIDRGARPFDGGFDIGADEFNSEQITTVPPPVEPPPPEVKKTLSWLLLLQEK